jgi:hypothetical protein
MTRDHSNVEPSPLVTRDELVGIFFVVADISENVKRIVQLLEEDDDGEAEEDTA